MGLADPSLHVILFVHTKRVLARDGFPFQRADDADAPGERDFGQTDETGIF